MVTVKRIEDAAYLRELEKKGCRQTVFTTYPWVRFLEKNRKAEPVILELSDGGAPVCVFVGLITSKFGVRILGSPFEGWLTEDMGFIRMGEMDAAECLLAVRDYAFRQLKCLFVQITDPDIDSERLPRGADVTVTKALTIDLARTEEEIMASFKKEAKRKIRKFEKNEAVLREVPFDERFAKSFYSQLLDVFAKQSLKPNYDLRKILDLVDAFRDDPDKVTAMQVFSPDGECIASSMYFGYGCRCYSLASASYREYQHFYPNEAIRWHGIRHWKEKGAQVLDMCGYRDYKMKFSPILADVPTVVMCRYRILIRMKGMAKKAIEIYRKAKGKLLTRSAARVAEQAVSDREDD